MKRRLSCIISASKINVPFNGLPMLHDGNKKSISEEEKNTARAHGYIQFLKSKLPSQAKVEKVYQETFNKRNKEALEKKTLEKIKTIDISYLKIVLEKEDPAIVEELYDTFEIQDLNNEALSCIIDKICYNNTLQDLENPGIVNKDNNIIIRHSYITFEGSQENTLRLFLSGKKLTTIDFSNNMLGDTGIKNLLNVLESVNLYHLVLANNSITRNGAGHIANWAGDTKAEKRLKTLNLSGNKLGDEGFADLSPALENLTSLSRLILSYNEINLLRPASITKFLKTNVLKILDLSHNKFEDEGIRMLMNILKKSPFLSHFMFSYNANIGLSGIEDIIGLYYIENLEILDLSHCKLNAKKASILLSSFLHTHIPKKINISHNDIRDAPDGQSTIFELVIKILKEKLKLEALDISGNQIGLECGLKIPYELICGLKPDESSNHSSLREFNAENNGMHEDSLHILLNIILASENLESINICGNNLYMGIIEVLGEILTSKKSLLQVKINLQDVTCNNRTLGRDENKELLFFTEETFIRSLRKWNDIIEKIEKSTLSNIININNTIVNFLKEDSHTCEIEDILNGKKINSVLLKEILSRMEVPYDIYHNLIKHFYSCNSLYHPLDTNPVMGDQIMGDQSLPGSELE